MNKNTAKAIQRRLDAGQKTFKIGDAWYHLGDILPEAGYRVLFRSAKYTTIHYRVINGILEV